MSTYLNCSDVSGLESHKVAELKNLYLLVSNQAFGGQRTLELLQCLQDIRSVNGNNDSFFKQII